MCALPFAPLRRVQLDAGFSHDKLAAIHELQYIGAACCYFQTGSRSWQHDPLGGRDLVGSDTMAGRVCNTSSQQPDPATGMLHAYMFDTEALEFASHGDRRVVEKSFTSLPEAADRPRLDAPALDVSLLRFVGARGDDGRVTPSRQESAAGRCGGWRGRRVLRRRRLTVATGRIGRELRAGGVPAARSAATRV